MKYAELLEKHEELLSENKKLKETIVELKSMIIEESTVNCIVKEAENLSMMKIKLVLQKRVQRRKSLIYIYRFSEAELTFAPNGGEISQAILHIALMTSNQASVINPGQSVRNVSKVILRHWTA